MKKLSLLLIGAILFTFNVLAQNNCAANFTYSVNAATRTVIFTNTSFGTGLIYNWTFGDGTFSSVQNPVKTFTSFGSKTVCLKVTKSDSSCTNTICSTFVITNPCNADWVKTIDSTNKLRVLFASLNTSNDFTFQWNFGDNTTSDLRTPVHTYTKAGTYKVCLIVSKKDSSCINYLCDSVVVSTASTCLATWSSHPDSANKLMVYFTTTNTSNDYTFKWNFGDNTTSDLRLPTHTYGKSGKYRVCFTVTKKDSTCSTTICDSVTVNLPSTCLATWTWHADSINTMNILFGTNNTSSDYNYKWTFGDNTSSDLRTPVHAYTKAGAYKVCLIVTKKDSTCANYFCDSIFVKAPVVTCLATWNSHPDSANKLMVYYAANNTSSDYIYKWSFGDNTASDMRTPLHTYAKAGTYKVCLTVMKKDSSCYNYHCDSIVVGANNIPPCIPNWTLFSDSTNQLKINFSAISANDYNVKWNFGDGTSSDSKTPSHIFAKAGRYKICLRVTRKDSTCTNEKCDSITVYENTGCEAGFTASRTNREVHFTNTSKGSYTRSLWFFGDSAVSDMNSPVHTFKKNGTYSVCLYIFRIVNGDTLCKSGKCISIIVDSVSAGCVASFTKVINNNLRKVELTNTSKGSNLVYFWTFGDDTVSLSTSPNHIYTHNGTYRVCLYVINSQDTSCKGMYCESVVIHKNDTMAPQGHPSAGFAYHTYSQSQNTLQFNPTSSGADLTFHWDFGDGESSDIAEPLHSYASNDWYLVCLTLTNAISSDVICENVNPDFATGLATLQKKNASLNVYPNPFSNQLTFEINGSSESSATITLIDLSGRTVMEKSVQMKVGKNEFVLDTHQMDGGFYVARIHGNDLDVQVKILK